MAGFGSYGRSRNSVKSSRALLKEMRYPELEVSLEPWSSSILCSLLSLMNLCTFIRILSRGNVSYFLSVSVQFPHYYQCLVSLALEKEFFSMFICVGDV